MDRIWEYRINYNSEGRGHTRYYNTENALQALENQLYVSKKNDEDIEVISVERHCPYSDKWLDETELATVSND